jgi:hypothetical protein
MRRRRMVWLSLAVAAVVGAFASTAYACVALKGKATVTGSVRASNQMIGSGAHDYCPGGEPVVAAAGPAGSTVSASFAPSTTGNCQASLQGGTYDVRLYNTNTGYEGADGVRWVQRPLSGCFVVGASSVPINYYLGSLTISSTGSGNGSWTVPSTATSNGPTDASTFCVGRRSGAANNQPATGGSDGFLAPFRVSTL